jgi:crossover junction endodeoxyribonuclease RuvC
MLHRTTSERRNRRAGVLARHSRGTRLHERMFDSCVLGVDPGVANLGLAAVARDGRRPTLLWADTVTTEADAAEADRLMALVRAVRAAIADHHPASVAVERVAFNRNQVSALTVARATGAVMVAAAELGLTVDEYSPTEVKSAVTGAGNADKRQVRDALERVHGFRDLPRKPDAVDAAAVALTHLMGARLRAAQRIGAAR